jgi:hydroxypyruvate isomerase
MASNTHRRRAIKSILTGTAAITSAGFLSSFDAGTGIHPQTLKGNINHSVCRWCFNSFSIEELCIAAREIGLKAIDIVGPKDWPTLQKYGLDSSMCNGAEINLINGFNDKQYHSTLIKQYSEMIPLMARSGYKNLICFSGNRAGKDDETGLSNCTEGFKQLVGLAEKHKVNLVMELLNSKVDHKDYQCDKTPWGVELVKRVGSDNFKLLYDIYHMQIDEGDVIRTIKANHQYFAHYHTAGVPGRHEIDETQELNYTAIMKAIVETGFKGYVAQEFIPVKADKLGSLRQAIAICDV